MSNATEHLGLHPDPVMNTPEERKTLTARSLARRFERALENMVGPHELRTFPAESGDFVSLGSLDTESFERLVRRMEEAL